MFERLEPNPIIWHEKQPYELTVHYKHSFKKALINAVLICDSQARRYPVICGYQCTHSMGAAAIIALPFAQNLINKQRLIAGGHGWSDKPPHSGG
jgi:hypothetical protein